MTLRALSVLAAFDDDHLALTLAEVGRRAELPMSTALRLARQLESWGALERDEEGRYVIGLRLFEVASLAPRSHGLRAVALPFLEDLHEVARQHVLLAIRDADQALLVERLSAHGAVTIAYRVGGRMPLDDTGVGIVLLAGAEDDVLARLAQRCPPDARALLERRIADYRRRGVAVLERSAPAPVSSIAAPVRDRLGATLAAVSVVVPRGVARPAAYEQVVRASALGIERGLRGPVPRVRERGLDRAEHRVVPASGPSSNRRAE